MYERYLFKKEKEQREARARRLERSLEAFELLSDSLSSFAHELNTTVTAITQLTNDSEQLLQRYLPHQGKEHLEAYLERVREEYKNLVVIGESIVSLSKVMNENYLRVQNMHQSEVELIANMKTPTERTSQRS